MSTYTFFPPGDQSLVMFAATRLLRRSTAGACTTFVVIT
jgi:hypothetical protein